MKGIDRVNEDHVERIISADDLDFYIAEQSHRLSNAANDPVAIQSHKTSPVFSRITDDVENIGNQLRVGALYLMAGGILLIAAFGLYSEFEISPVHAAFFGTIGVVSAWRYGWWAVHFFRALCFLYVRFPKLRSKTSLISGQKKIEYLYAIVMSYDIPSHQFGTVYRALFQNILEYGVPATIVASITSAADREILGRVYRDIGSPDNIEIVVQFQEGKGKRSAMAMALKCIARRVPHENSLVVFMDGDIFLPASVLSNTIPFFIADPELDALTTNNDAVVDGSLFAANWYALRYAQRHIVMSSLSMSDRLLVLTGRFSIYRIADAISREFIEIIENDSMTHWLHGKFSLLSGDDKSIWFHMLRLKRKMLYVPDVKVVGYEALPDPTSFLKSTSMLMMRWYGNMLRTNARAVMLGPSTCGFFTWWCLIDQRLSMWTSLIGPITAVLFSIIFSPQYLYYYLAWVLLTRIVMSLLAGMVWGRYSSVWPFLLYYNQLWGAFLKTYISFRLDKQVWTRQRITNSHLLPNSQAITSTLLHFTAMMLLVIAVGKMSGAFGDMPWYLF